MDINSHTIFDTSFEILLAYIYTKLIRKNHFRLILFISLYILSGKSNALNLKYNLFISSAKVIHVFSLSKWKMTLITVQRANGVSGRFEMKL
jgi:hypothetical protein